MYRGGRRDSRPKPDIGSCADPGNLLMCRNVLASTIDRSRHFCYALVQAQAQAQSRARTYVGYSVDPRRRLRQHNGEITGGAWRTRRSFDVGPVSSVDVARPRWDLLFVVAVEGAAASAFGAREALSLEWHLKRRPKTAAPRVAGAALRVAALAAALALPKFCGGPLADAFVVYARPDLVDDIWVATLPLAHAVVVTTLAEFDSDFNS